MVADGVTAALLFGVLALFRYGEAEWDTLWRALGTDLWVAAAVYGCAWVAALWYHGLYELRLHWRLQTEIRGILRATFFVALFVLSLLFVTRREDVSRLFLVILFVAQPALTTLSRVVMRRFFSHVRSRGMNHSYMLIVGANTGGQSFADKIEAHRALGIHVVGHLVAPDEDPASVTRPILGTVDQIAEILHERPIDEIGMCLAVASRDLAEAATRLCTEEGKVVRIPSVPLEMIGAERSTEEFDGLLVHSTLSGPPRTLGLIAKRGVDIVLAAIGLVILGPLMLAVAAAIWRLEGRPILFRQTRIGRHGRPFTMYKFRTMHRDAEDRLSDLESLNERRGPAFKITNDPRITRSGRVLRASSMDELPQLWNVLRGDMSLVGPRPALPREIAEYDVWHRRRLSMSPGITGLWQVRARQADDFDVRAQLDLVYIDTWSLLLDLKIMLRTIPAVIGGGGR